MKILRTDEELLTMRKEWKIKKNTPFPPYNYDEYGGIDDYKEKIRRRLASSKSSPD